MKVMRKRDAWNKGKLVGQKPPLKPKDIWAIRIHLQNAHAFRELAMFNLAIDSKLRGCGRQPSSTRRYAWEPDTPSGYGGPEENPAASAVRVDGADESGCCRLAGEDSASGRQRRPRASSRTRPSIRALSLLVIGFVQARSWPQDLTPILVRSPPN